MAAKSEFSTQEQFVSEDDNWHGSQPIWVTSSSQKDNPLHMIMRYHLKKQLDWEFFATGIHHQFHYRCYS